LDPPAERTSRPQVSTRTVGVEEERLRVAPDSSTFGQPDTVAAAALAHRVTVGGAVEARGGMHLSVAALQAADAIALPGWASVVTVARAPAAAASTNVFALPAGAQPFRAAQPGFLNCSKPAHTALHRSNGR
jgi:hypothetical protein